MTKCTKCGKDTDDPKTQTCSGNYVEYKDDVTLVRLNYPEDEIERCPVCHVMSGGLHHDGCYMERCPRCGQRLISCGCLKG